MQKGAVAKRKIAPAPKLWAKLTYKDETGQILRKTAHKNRRPAQEPPILGKSDAGNCLCALNENVLIRCILRCSPDAHKTVIKINIFQFKLTLSAFLAIFRIIAIS